MQGKMPGEKFSEKMQKSLEEKGRICISYYRKERLMQSKMFGENFSEKNAKESGKKEQDLR